MAEHIGVYSGIREAAHAKCAGGGCEGGRLLSCECWVVVVGIGGVDDLVLGDQATRFAVCCPSPDVVGGDGLEMVHPELDLIWCGSHWWCWLWC